jgi:hypothetical protein
MSDLLNKASLVLIPSGYKEDTVYSVVPSDGSGDLSFTRASNGTRINSSGLVEVVPWNLVEQSETFDNAYWTKNRSSITANSTTAPNGTATADSLIEDTANGTHEFITVLAVDLQTYSFSIYAKANTRSKIQLVLAGTPWATGGNGEVSFDLSTGAVISAVNGASGVIESVGNGWYRCTITKITSVADPSGVLAVRLLDASGNSSYTGNGTSGAYYYGAQLNIGSTAKPYFPTTDRLNVPRLTYQNGGGGCPSLLLEKQSTNLATYSEQFDNADWSKLNLTVTANATTSPDGTTNADKLIPNTSNTDHSIYQGSTNGVVRTFSVFAKANGYNYIFLGYGNNVASEGVFFNLTNGTISQNTSTLTASIESFGNGWYRCIVSQASWPSVYAFLAVSQNGSGFVFAGNGTDGISVWGAQLEQSSYPTSYIPTTSASATRVGDACYKTGISSLIGQTSGTLFADFKVDNANPGARIISVSDGTFANRIVLLQDGSAIRVFVATASVGQVDNSFGTWIGRHKIAVAYANNDLVVFLDGVLVATDTSISVPACSAAQVGTREDNTDATPLQGTINQAILFPTRLTNAELASLTTL